MDTRIDEIAEGVFRLSVHVPDIAPPAGFTFNHFLVLGDEPLLFHTGLRRMFPLLREAVSRLIPPESLRWVSFGHYEADECGAMNEWLSVAPQAEVAHDIGLDVESRPSHQRVACSARRLGQQTNYGWDERAFSIPQPPHRIWGHSRADGASRPPTAPGSPSDVHRHRQARSRIQ